MSQCTKTACNKAMTVDRDKRLLTATISTRSVDRDGDIVEPEGIDFTNFKSNPVVLWAHNPSQPPIGKIEELYVSPTGVMAEIKFAETAFAKDIFNLYADGFLNAWSIGFSALKGHTEPRLDEDGRTQGYVFRKTELLELSAVPIPANPEALTRSMKSFDTETLSVLSKSFETLPESVKSEVGDFADEVNKEFTRRSHNSTVADNEPSWGNVDRTSLPEVAFVWQAAGTDVEKKSTWKFPHHWVQNGGNPNDMGIYTTGEMFLHRGGLNAAWAAAMGARSGQEAERAVINHIQAHRKALGIDEKHFYATFDDEGCKVFGVKDFDELGEGESPFEPVELKLRETSFNKSMSERGTKGDVPVHVKFGETPSTEVDFLIVQEAEGEVVEAKVLQVSVTLPTAKQVDAPEEGREEELIAVEPTTEETEIVVEPQEEAQDEHEVKTVEVPAMAGKSLNDLTVAALKLKHAELMMRCLNLGQ
jgi:HK97 family phage prohead protease